MIRVMINSQPLALIVDDAVFNRRLLAAMLAVNGIRSIEAENGKEALDKLDEVTPDIILLDIMMPVMDGFQTLSIIKQRGYTFPVIILTADCQESTKEICLEMGASYFVTKPIRHENILELVNIFIKSNVNA